MAKIIDPVLNILSVWGCRAIVLGSLGGLGRPEMTCVEAPGRKMSLIAVTERWIPDHSASLCGCLEG